jgi:hypothetical protein
VRSCIRLDGFSFSSEVRANQPVEGRVPKQRFAKFSLITFKIC